MAPPPAASTNDATIQPGRSAPARAPRAEIAESCTLRRRSGSTIAGETLDLGPEGMRVKCRRPLSSDETLQFELPNLVLRVAGRALVLRQERPDVYVLRFEPLPEPMARCLRALAMAGRRGVP